MREEYVRHLNYEFANYAGVGGDGDPHQWLNGPIQRPGEIGAPGDTGSQPARRSSWAEQRNEPTPLDSGRVRLVQPARMSSDQDQPVASRFNSGTPVSRSTVEVELSQGRFAAAPFFESLRRKMLDQLAEIELRRQAPILERVAEAEEQAAILAHNDQQAVALEADRRIARRIVAALERMKANEFGVCCDCEEPISQKRLEVVAFAERCRGCQERQEEREMAEATGFRGIEEE